MNLEFIMFICLNCVVALIIYLLYKYKFLDIKLHLASHADETLFNRYPEVYNHKSDYIIKSFNGQIKLLLTLFYFFSSYMPKKPLHFVLLYVIINKNIL